jgi:mono/diheme cytochrome c family protein
VAIAWRNRRTARRSAIGRFSAIVALVCAALTVTGISSASGRRRETEAVYLEDCARCHATSKEQDEKRAGSFNDCEMAALMSDATLFLAIKSGAAAIGAPSKMPAFNHVLSYDEITALVAYVRRLCNARSQPLLTAP